MLGTLPAFLVRLVDVVKGFAARVSCVNVWIPKVCDGPPESCAGKCPAFPFG